MGLTQELRDKHFRDNKEWWNRTGKNLAVHPKTGFIENQNQLVPMHYGKEIPFFDRLFFGKRPITAKENSCEVIALYNVLKTLDGEENTPSFPELLQWFEGKGIFLWGYFGTHLGAVKKYLLSKGYEVKRLPRKQLDRENPGAVCYIMMTMNHRYNLFRMIHTVCITKEQSGYVIHNDYEGSKEYKSLKQAVFGYHEGIGRPLEVLEIRKKKEQA